MDEHEISTEQLRTMTDRQLMLYVAEKHMSLENWVKTINKRVKSLEHWRIAVVAGALALGWAAEEILKMRGGIHVGP